MIGKAEKQVEIPLMQCTSNKTVVYNKITFQTLGSTLERNNCGKKEK